MAWFLHVLDSYDPAVKSVVVGMHAALPDSLVVSHRWVIGPLTKR